MGVNETECTVRIKHDYILADEIDEEALSQTSDYLNCYDYIACRRVLHDHYMYLSRKYLKIACSVGA